MYMLENPGAQGTSGFKIQVVRFLKIVAILRCLSCLKGTWKYKKTPRLKELLQVMRGN